MLFNLIFEAFFPDVLMPFIAGVFSIDVSVWVNSLALLSCYQVNSKPLTMINQCICQLACITDHAG